EPLLARPILVAGQDLREPSLRTKERFHRECLVRVHRSPSLTGGYGGRAASASSAVAGATAVSTPSLPERAWAGRTTRDGGAASGSRTTPRARDTIWEQRSARACQSTDAILVHGIIQPAVAEGRSDVSGVLDAPVERHGAMPGTKTSGRGLVNKCVNGIRRQ